MYHGHARHSALTAALFLFEGVWGVVGAYGAERGGEGEAEGVAVIEALDGGVALDEGAFLGVVFLGEEQVGDGGFASDACAEEGEFAGGGDMGYVELCAVFLC